MIRKEEGTGEDYRSNITSRFDINWEEPFICTTFVQFMNALFSDKGESIRRMHRLIHSAVIIDEVQSMPLKVRTYIQLYDEFFKCGMQYKYYPVYCHTADPGRSKVPCVLQ